MASGSVMNIEFDGYMKVDIGSSRTCKSCGIPLETYGKYYSLNGGVSGVVWQPISSLISPDYNRCSKCYEKQL